MASAGGSFVKKAGGLKVKGKKVVSTSSLVISDSMPASSGDVAPESVAEVVGSGTPVMAQPDVLKPPPAAPVVAMPIGLVGGAADGSVTVPPQPAPLVTTGSEVVKFMFDKDAYSGQSFTLPGEGSLPAGKYLKAGNAAEYGVSLDNALAKVGGTGKGYIVASGSWLAALTESSGEFEYKNGVLAAHFVDGSTAYASHTQVGGNSQLLSHCTCGQHPCRHQLVVQATYLSGLNGSKLLNDNYFGQQVAAKPPTTLETHAGLTAQRALQMQDAYYRSLQHLDVKGVQIVVGAAGLVKQAAQEPVSWPLVSSPQLEAEITLLEAAEVEAAEAPPILDQPAELSASPQPLQLASYVAEAVDEPHPTEVQAKETAGVQPVKTDAVRQGGLAVIKSPQGYKVIHVPSGLSLTVYSSSQEQAVALMRKLNQQAVDWQSFDHAGLHNDKVLLGKVKAAVIAVGSTPKQTNGIWQQPVVVGLKAPAVNDQQVAAGGFSGEYQVKSITAADNYMTTAYAGWAASLKQKEKKAFKSYQGNIGYKQINDHLWKGAAASVGVVDKIKAMDEAIARSSLPATIRSYRIKPQNSQLYQQMQAAVVGGSYISLGFDSTSINPNWSWSGSHNGVQVEYRLPAGAKAAYFNSFSNSYTSEYELMPARGSVWRVATKSVNPNGRLDVVLELISQPE